VEDKGLIIRGGHAVNKRDNNRLFLVGADNLS